MNPWRREGKVRVKARRTKVKMTRREESQHRRGERKGKVSKVKDINNKAKLTQSRPSEADADGGESFRPLMMKKREKRDQMR